MELRQIMRLVELFRGLNDEQLGTMENITRKEIYEAGDVIFSQGEDGDKMYIVGSGQVEIKIRNPTGYTYSAVYLGEGQVFGEMALIDDATRSATVISAHDNTTVYAIPRTDFTELCTTNTAIGYLMMRNIAQDISFKLRHKDFNQPSDD